MKELNKATILDIIRTTKEFAKAWPIAQDSPTAAGAIEELLGAQLKEVGEGKSSGGRKPVILEINPDSHLWF